MTRNNKVVILIGTRPEAIKLIPLYLSLKSAEDFEPIIVSTGQHREMLNQVFDFFGVKPDHDLELMFKNQSLAGITSLLFKEIQGCISKIDPNMIVVQGDTQSAMVGGMIGFYNKIKVAHIEAGLRTYNKYSPFPEEVNRQMIGLVADVHFAPTSTAMNNLLAEKKENVFNVGNTVIDALMLCLDIIKKNRDKYAEKFEEFLGYDRLVLITGHRRENFGSGLKNMMEAIRELATKYGETCFVYPVHLNPIVREEVNLNLTGIDNVKLIEPLVYDELVFLLSKSYCVITDSGGIQEEAPSFDLPILVTREVTERPEGVEEGCAILVGTNKDMIIGEYDKLVNDHEHYDKMALAKNPYGDGKTSEKIVDKLRSFLG